VRPVLQHDSARSDQQPTYAVHCAGRRIDTALCYQTEDQIGRAIKDSGVPRSEIFITSKVTSCNGSAQGYNETLIQQAQNLQLLQTTYVDLLLVCLKWCLQLPPPPPFHPPTITFGLCAVISPWSRFHHCARLLGLGCRQLIPTVGTLLTVRWGPTCVLLCPRMQIHWPGPPSKDATKDPACQAPDADGRWGSCRRATWRAMLKLLADGTDGGSRAVGVSNFERDHLMDLMPVSIHI
jgi:diketogulonate reductase-like aldo/keto reductase